MTRSTIALAASLLLVTALPALAQRKDGPVQRLSWISGCWLQSGRGGRTVDEQWMAPRGGTMLGMSRTVRGDTALIEFEHLQILERNGRAIYHAEPSGQKPTDFEAQSVSDSLVTFENPSHDFPQRIIYRRRGPDTLIARVEGAQNGQLRGFDFSYARTPCPGR